MLWLLWAFADGSGGAGRPPYDDPGSRQADLETVRRIAAGEPDALAALYDRHARAVYSLAFRVLGDAPEAEEVVQDVFAQVWGQAPRYDERRGVVVAWLLIIARSRAIDRIRARRGLPPFAHDVLKGLADMEDPGDGPEMLALTSEQVTRLRQAVDRLSLAERTSIELAFFEGLTHHEIAERLELPLGTVKTRIRRGLSKLRVAVMETSA